MLKTNILSITLSSTTEFYYEYKPGIILTMNDKNQKVRKNILCIKFILNRRVHGAVTFKTWKLIKYEGLVYVNSRLS